MGSSKPATLAMTNNNCTGPACIFLLGVIVVSGCGGQRWGQCHEARAIAVANTAVGFIEEEGVHREYNVKRFGDGWQVNVSRFRNSRFGRIYDMGVTAVFIDSNWRVTKG